MPRRKLVKPIDPPAPDYGGFVSGLEEVVEQSRHRAARVVNGVLTATYWEVGRRIVEFEQGGEVRAGYGEGLLKRLSADLTAKFGRGFSRRNIEQMRNFYLGWRVCSTDSSTFEARAIFPEPEEKAQTPSAEFQTAVVHAKPPDLSALFGAFPLSWSHYTRLMSVEKPHARAFYESEAIRGGWSVRQLTRQVGTQFFERTSASKRQAAMIAGGQHHKPEDAVSARDEVRDPYLLEFLDLKDEYSETELEGALIHHLESFLLELGTGFAFIARQKRIRVGDEWYRIDLLLYHRGLRCLVVIDLKTGAFSHADAGQMNLYLNYAREHLTLPDEADPVGIILCADKNDAVVKYATGGIRTQVFASKYLTRLPDEETLRREIMATQHALEHRSPAKKDRP